MKVLFGMPLRQTTGFVESLLRLAGLDWKVPDFSTLCRRQKTLNVAIPYRGGSGPLRLLIDGTGIKAEGEGEWNTRKHGGPKKGLWRKLHLGINEETFEIRAVCVTTSNVGDALMLPDLLEQIPPDQAIATVTADGAYDTRRCHNVIAARGAAAIIPPHKNAQLWKPTTAGAIARNEAVRAGKYLGRALWRKLTGYHRRSRAETKTHCVKLLGQGVMARDFDRQVAELQVRIAVLNRSWYTSHRVRRISPSRERGSPLKTRFVQQSWVSLKALLRQYAIKGNKFEVIAREGDTTDLQISIQSLQNVAQQSKAAFFDFTSRS